MKRIYVRGRNRILDPEKKAKLCELVAQSATIEQAAETLDVSLRTIQRERKFDEDFDHELRLALQSPPDPKLLMESAARVHWRAAAWLLERTDPERYAKRPASSASPRQVEAALTFVLEAALEAVAPEQRDAVYEHVQAACDEAFNCVFPNYGPWGRRRSPQLPPTPLADRQQLKRFSAPPCHDQPVDKAFDHDAGRRAPAAQQPPAEVTPPPAPGPTTQRPPHDPWWEASPTLVLRDANGGCDQQATPAADNPSWAAAPSTTPPATPSAAKTPPSAPRLPWQFRLRTAQSTRSILPRARASSGSLFCRQKCVSRQNSRPATSPQRRSRISRPQPNP